MNTLGTLNTRTTLSEIRALLRADGYHALLPRAREIKQAFAHGALVWTTAQLTTTDQSRINARPTSDIE